MYNYTPRFYINDMVEINSKTSKLKGKIGTIIRYCDGRYPNICTVFVGGKNINYFDTSLELVVN